MSRIAPVELYHERLSDIIYSVSPRKYHTLYYVIM